MKRLLGYLQRHILPRKYRVEYPERFNVGKNVVINYGVHIIARYGVRIGNNVHLSVNSMLISAGLENGQHVGAEINIDDDVWIGAGAIVLPGITVGKGAVVGAGAVVTKDVAPNTTVVGVPAKLI